jgi:hypothetical protein
MTHAQNADAAAGASALGPVLNQSLPKIQDHLQPWLLMSSAITPALSGEQVAAPA